MTSPAPAAPARRGVEPPRPPSILIVGGGVSGTVLAAALLERAIGPLLVQVVEPRAELGRGLPYSTREPDHRVNAEARKLSLRPDEPDHFADWLRRDASLTGDVRELFVSRRLFGDYAQSILESAKRKGARHGARLAHHRAEAIDLALDPFGATLTLPDRTRIEGDAAVLATGLLPSLGAFADMDDAVRDDPRFILDPWDTGTLERLPRDAAVAILGSGLTMLDVVISLERSGHRGPIHVVSRHGMFPHPRLPAPEWPDFLDAIPAATPLSALLGRVKDECRRARRETGDWQAAINAVRPHLQRLWSGASDAERRRFMRHLRHWWESHHHRAPPDAIALVERLRRQGRIELVIGRIVSITPEPSGRVALRLHARAGREARHLAVDAAVNAISIDYDWGRSDQPLARALLARGLVRLGPLRLGIDADDEGRVIGVGGRPQERLFTLGPTLRGVRWETTAVPDILAQAHGLADHLARWTQPTSIAAGKLEVG